MVPSVVYRYTGVKAKNILLENRLKAMTDAEEAREARKRPQAGMTAAHLGTYRLSTAPVLAQ